MGHAKAAILLQETLDEEKAADEKLTSLAESGINQDAADAAHPRRRRRRRRGEVAGRRAAVAGRRSAVPNVPPPLSEAGGCPGAERGAGIAGLAILSGNDDSPGLRIFRPPDSPNRSPSALALGAAHRPGPRESPQHQVYAVRFASIGYSVGNLVAGAIRSRSSTSR